MIDHILFGSLVFLAVFHVPLLAVGTNSIGLFDFYAVGYVAYVLVKSLRAGLNLERWRDLLIGFWLLICYEAVMLLATRSTYSILLVAKHVELFAVLVSVIVYFETCRPRPDDVFRLFQAVVVALTAFQIVQFLTGGFVRVGLPFKEGLSPNPAGFILATSLVFHIEVLLKRTRAPLVFATAGLSAVALVLTMSRTNLLAIVLVYAIATVAKLRRFRTFVGGMLLGALFIGGLYLVADGLREDYDYMNRIYQAIRDPGSMLRDSSFMIRSTQTWPRSFSAWLRTPLTVLVGNGLGYYEVVDGTVPRLLGNLGIVGLILFAYLWFGFYLLNFNSRPVRRLLLLAAINSITVETLVSSFRTIQVYMLFLILTAYASRELFGTHAAVRVGGRAGAFEPRRAT